MSIEGGFQTNFLELVGVYSKWLKRFYLYIYMYIWDNTQKSLCDEITCISCIVVVVVVIYIVYSV